MRVLYPWFIAPVARGAAIAAVAAPNAAAARAGTATPANRSAVAGVAAPGRRLGAPRSDATITNRPTSFLHSTCRTASAPPCAGRRSSFIRAVSGAKRPQDGAGLVVFGADAFLEHGVARRFSLPDIASEVDGSATNIARALQVSAASFPAEGAKRLVLLSDGNENVASAGRGRPDRPLPRRVGLSAAAGARSAGAGGAGGRS